MSFTRQAPPERTSPMLVGSVNDNSPQHEYYDSQVERWLATCSSSSNPQLEPTAGTRSDLPPEALPSKLSHVPTGKKPWQNEMSMLQALPDQAIARRLFGVLEAFPTLTEQQTFESQRGESHWKIRATDSLSLGAFHPSKDPRDISLTDKSTTTSDAYFSWPDSSDNFMAVNPRDTLATSTLSPDPGAFQGEQLVANFESASSSPEDDSHWEADLDTHPSITPISSFSQGSSDTSWIDSNAFNNIWFGSSQASRARFHCQCNRSQYEPARTDTTIALQTPSEFEAMNPRFSWSRSEEPLSTSNIPKSVPLDYQLTMDLAELGLTPTTSTGSLGEDTQPVDNAPIVPKPSTYDYSKGIKLLEQAVDEALASIGDPAQHTQVSLGGGIAPKSLKISWKQVSERIYKRGGSYKFGNATCRKKWDEMFGDRQIQGNLTRDK
ncbi:MAG: hypothetical protein Q9195_005872 [Heterodermia aff. obscurata]